MSDGFRVNRDDRLYVIVAINGLIALVTSAGIIAVLMGAWP